MADRVDAAVNAMQPAAPDPPVDRTAFETEGAQLQHRDNAMLSSGERRHPRIPRSAKKYMTVVNFLAHPGNRPRVAVPHPSSMTVFSAFRREAVTSRS